jgi:hypothetical protein
LEKVKNKKCKIVNCISSRSFAQKLEKNRQKWTKQFFEKTFLKNVKVT